MTFQIQTNVLRFATPPTRRTATNAIIIHHIGTPNGRATAQQIHNSHNNSGKNGIGYNLYVAMDGTITEGRGIFNVGAHTNPPSGTNSTTVGIGCEGNFDTVDRTMPDIQFNALVWLIKYLRGIFGDIPIRGHREMLGAATACPGRHFPLDEVRTLKFRGVSEPEQRIFNDTADHWAETVIDELQAFGIVNGDGEQSPDNSLFAGGNFRPNDPITRAEAAQMCRNVVRFVTGK